MRNSASSLSVGEKKRKQEKKIKKKKQNAVGIVCSVVSKLRTRILYGKEEECRRGFEEAAVVCEVDNMFTDVCQEKTNK